MDLQEYIYYRIELTKQSILSVKEEIEKNGGDDWLYGYMAGLKRELNTLEDLLQAQQEERIHGSVAPF